VILACPINSLACDSNLSHSHLLTISYRTGTEPLDSTHILQKSVLARNDVEQIARQLLIKYDGNGAGPQYAERTSCAPWEELSSNSQTARYCYSVSYSLVTLYLVIVYLVIIYSLARL